ncbi:MAG: hypothetical protein O3A46_13715, partial [Candidatus Poribacteria bacterium]|nr:hypothetical protein [Candidatus Poribacteria bacterium]
TEPDYGAAPALNANAHARGEGRVVADIEDEEACDEVAEDDGAEMENDQDERRGAHVVKETSGELHLGPLALTMCELEAVASFDANWKGWAHVVVTPSGIRNRVVRIDTLRGRLTLEHDYEDVPSPLVIGIHATGGSLKEHVDVNLTRKPDVKTAITIKVDDISLFDVESGGEIEWHPDVFGPKPRVIRIRGDQVVFVSADDMRGDNTDDEEINEDEGGDDAEDNAAPAPTASNRTLRVWSKMRAF